MALNCTMRPRTYLCFIAILLFLSYCDGAVDPENRSPVILDISISPTVIGNGTTVLFTANAVDEDGDSLVFKWECPVGAFRELLGSSVRWTSPGSGSGTATMKVTVSDGVSSFEKSKVFDWGQ